MSVQPAAQRRGGFIAACAIAALGSLCAIIIPRFGETETVPQIAMSEQQQHSPKDYNIWENLDKKFGFHHSAFNSSLQAHYNGPERHELSPTR